MAIVGAFAVVQIENIRQTFFLVIVGPDVFLFKGTIGARAFASVVHPANEVIVIVLFADASEIGGEGAALHLVKGSLRADCHKYAEMDLICMSLKRKSGILVVARKALGFCSQTGIQFLFSLSRISLRLGPTFFMSCRRLLLVRSS